MEGKSCEFVSTTLERFFFTILYYVIPVATVINKVARFISLQSGQSQKTSLKKKIIYYY